MLRKDAGVDDFISDLRTVNSILDETAGTTSGGGINLTLLDWLPHGGMTATLFLLFSHTLLCQVHRGP
jgi:hypothetical protein